MSPETGPASPPLKVCSFNIRNGDADDGPNSWPHRAQTVVDLLREIDADIFGLQEVMDYQLDFILQQLPEWGFVGVGRIDGDREGEFAPILYRKRFFQPKEQGWFWLSETPEIRGSKAWDTACERICTWADFGGFRFYNTHLDHVSEEAQRRGVELILSRMDAGPTIVVGDFNVLPTDPPIRAMLDAGFADAIKPASQSTFHNWRTEVYGQIDYIFARGFRSMSAQVWVEPRNGRDASDHFPVVADMIQHEA